MRGPWVILCALAAALAAPAPVSAHDVTYGDTAWSLMSGRAGKVQRFTAPIARAAVVTQPFDALPATWCPAKAGTTTNDTAYALFPTLPVFKVVYAYPSDRPNRFDRFADFIQARMRDIAQQVYVESGARKTVRHDLGTACGPAYFDIQTVALPQNQAYYSTGSADSLGQHTRISQDVDAAVGTAGNQPRNLVIWADDVRLVAAGAAEDTSSYIFFNPANYPNGLPGGYHAVVFGDGSSTFLEPGAANDFAVTAPMHEMFHTLGAVSAQAVHHNAASAGHCTDEHDVMCYGAGTAIECPTGTDITIDCNKDDYFKPLAETIPGKTAPVINTYDSQFLCAIDGCFEREPSAPAPPPAPPGPPPPPPPGPGAPIITAARLSNLTVAVTRLNRVTARVTSSAATPASLLLERRGRRPRCTGPLSRCLRYVRVGRVRMLQLKTGRNSVLVSRKLAFATYRLSLTPSKGRKLSKLFVTRRPARR